MIKIIFCQVLFSLLYLNIAYAQEPIFTWGPAIEQDPHLLQEMQVIGSSDGRGFYAYYTEDGKATLERYNEHNQRIWATALLPKTPSNQPATFLDVVLLQNRLYLLSTFRAKGTTTCYAQEITPNGNYEATVQALAVTQGNGRPHVVLSENKAMLLVTLSENTNKTIVTTLYDGNLQLRWSKTLTGQGNVQQTLLQNNGTAHLLVTAATAKSTFLLYTLPPQNGNPEPVPIDHDLYRPLQASMAATPNQGLVVAGYYASVANATETHPEPKGTFYYRFERNQAGGKPVSVYTPFNAVFLRDYKRYKPDADKIQRLRNLQLRQVVPQATGGVILIGEEAYTSNVNGSRVFHHDDIIVARLSSEGTPIYTTSANKQQLATNDSDRLSSYLATTRGDTLHLLYLDFEYNYTAENTIVIAGPGAINKGPVLVTIPPSGRPQQVMPLHHSQTGRATGFYLRPAAGQAISGKELVVLGIGKNYYKYGRLKLE